MSTATRLPEVRRSLHVLTTVLILAAVSAGCGGGTSTGDKGYVSSTGITRLAVADRKVVGTIEGTTLEGDRLSLKQYAGKVVVLNVWGSWCGPCREEAAKLAAAARTLGTDGVVFVGVNTKDASPDQGLAFDKRFDVPYPSLYDPSGRTLLAFPGILNPSAIPSTVVIDTQGRVAARILGPVTSQLTLVDLVKDVEK